MQSGKLTNAKRYAFTVEPMHVDSFFKQVWFALLTLIILYFLVASDVRDLVKGGVQLFAEL